MTADTTTTTSTDDDAAPAGSPAAIRESLSRLHVELEPDTSDRPDRDRSGKRVDDPTDSTDGSSSGRTRKRTRTKTGGRKRPRKGRSDAGRRRRGSYREPLTQTLSVIGATVASFDPFDGAVIIANAEKVARQLDEAAQENEAIARALDALTSGGTGIAAVAIGLAPVVMPILWNHGLLPDMDLVANMAPDGTLPLSRRRNPDGSPVVDDDDEGGDDQAPADPAAVRALAAVVNGSGLDPSQVSTPVDRATGEV